MDGLRAEDQGVHIQHAFESRNDVGNWATDGEGKIEPQELGHKAVFIKVSKNYLKSHYIRGITKWVIQDFTKFLYIVPTEKNLSLRTVIIIGEFLGK
jgi:hypothetical protein